MILSQVDGCSLPVKILPKSSINKIVGWEGENLKIKICSAPEDGKANAALVLFLSKALDVPKAHIEITHGQTSRIKYAVVCS